jgi:hypothetical protein
MRRAGADNMVAWSPIRNNDRRKQDHSSLDTATFRYDYRGLICLGSPGEYVCYM